MLPILLRAFILRRVALLSEVENDLVLLGSPHSGATLRLEEFLTRNGQPFTYAEVEGDPAVLEATAPGGQAGTSSRIENYLGFPTGISGEALAARALTQAEKFGAELAIAQRTS